MDFPNIKNSFMHALEVEVMPLSGWTKFISGCCKLTISVISPS
jgi:hypothetical protein